MSILIKKIQNVASSNNLWERGSKIVIGVSGGPDSVCLLTIMAEIKEKCKFEIQIGHVNYGLRGKESKKDEELVKKLAEKYEIGLSILKLEKIKNFSEENMRNIRYDFLENVRKELDYDFIAVAHNQDDQVETFLMRIIRGAGLQGLSGMKYRTGKIIRPLLEVSREEIIGYLKKGKIKYRLDKTNKENLFLRNRIRNKLIPYLEKKFNPNIKGTIFDATLNISEDLSFISEYSEKLSKSKKNIKVSEIINVHPAIQRRLILAEIEKVKGNLKNIESSHIKEILKIIRSKKNKNQVFLFQGLKLVRKGDKLYLIKITNKQ